MNLNQRYNPFPVNSAYDGIYAHGVGIPMGSNMLTVSGQVGVSATGDAPQDFAGQVKLALENLRLVLTEAGMDFQDLVHMRFYVTQRHHLKELANIRTQYLDGVAPAVTTFIVSGLVEENWLVEIEGLASRPAKSMVSDLFARML